jgi:hypothetical protein
LPSSYTLDNEVTIDLTRGGLISSVGGVNATPSEIPLPAAFPLFATGLGALGLLGGWRTKRKATAAS